MLTKTAEKILERKYYLKDVHGNPTENFAQLCARVSYHVAKTEQDIEYWTGRYWQLMTELWFLPAGRILANANTKNGVLYNCFVLGIEDSRTDIYTTLAKSAEIFAHGGGIGYNFSNLRECGAPVSNGSMASGPVSFLKLFDTSADVISQSSRRGAQMAILNVDHMDIDRFIRAKDVQGELEHFNLSVGITDLFMEAALGGHSIDLYSRYDGDIVVLDACELLTKIAEHAWATGEPGIIFLDALERDNATPHLGVINSTNPCGEAPLLPGEACCLGSINLTKMLTDTEDGLVVDSQKLAYTVSVAVRFLDAVHNVSHHLDPESADTILQTRKIGLGVCGLADTLAMLNLQYDSPEALELAAYIGETMQRVAYETSKFLAEEKGAYPAFDEDKSRNIWFSNESVTPTRNAMLLSFAPTGTTSLVMGVNSGIEPFFALDYKKNVTEGDRDIKYQIQNKIDYTTKVAHEISPIDHVRMQAVWQSFVDGAISKTINLPNSATVEDIRDVIIHGWKLGLKGMTVYRDESRDFQILERN